MEDAPNLSKIAFRTSSSPARPLPTGIISGNLGLPGCILHPSYSHSYKRAEGGFQCHLPALFIVDVSECGARSKEGNRDEHDETGCHKQINGHVAYESRDSWSRDWIYSLTTCLCVQRRCFEIK